MAPPNDLLDFTGKSVLITGAATGIGRAVAVGFAERGATIAIGDVNEDAVGETLERVRGAGAEAFFRKSNVADEREVEALVAETVGRFGRLDCAFNNAGIGHAPQPIAELDADAFDRVIAVDLRGVFLCMKYELREMLRGGRGAIVNTASVAGVIAEPGVSGYVAAKHAVIGLTKTAAIEYAARGIRANVLAPGWVDTPMTAAWESDRELNERLRANAPMHRPASPEEMVAAVLYLCSDAASYVSGQVHVVDGALTVRGMFPTETMAAL
jgi:NAD(P)-dependent dehydrogenase (short-subunit alcohol dehydrogenase family)